jgi:hypothetical protein
MSEENQPALLGGIPERNSSFLSLDDVKEALEAAFEDELELRWVSEAWAALIELGLANYSNELEYCEAAINLVALVEFYKDWLATAGWEDARN